MVAWTVPHQASGSESHLNVLVLEKNLPENRKQAQKEMRASSFHSGVGFFVLLVCRVFFFKSWYTSPTASSGYVHSVAAFTHTK